MARGDKPYRVYRGGRVKGRVPLQRRVEPTSRQDGRRRPDRPAAPAPVTTPRQRRGWGRRIGIGLLILLLLVVAWGVASYLMLGRAVGDANQRLGPVALDDQSGLLLTNPTTTLLLGTDHGPGRGREDARRSDSIMLVRTDPDRGRTLLSLDPAGPPRRRTRPRLREDQRRVPVRRPRPRRADDPRLHRPADQPCRRRRLPELRAADRRARRREGEGARADRLEPLRLPVPDA